MTDEALRPAERRSFVDIAFRDEIPVTGTAITKILPPVARFSPTGGLARTSGASSTSSKRSSLATLDSPTASGSPKPLSKRIVYKLIRSSVIG